MSIPADHSSELQRKFFELCSLKTGEQVEAYLERECGKDPAERQILNRLLSASKNRLCDPLLDAEQKLRGVGDAVTSVAESFAESTADEKFPEVDRYQVLDLLGEGNMGRVYHARQIEPIEREVALKVIKPGMDSRQVLARFNREKQMLATLDHPHISKVFDAGMTDDGYPFFSMELVRGEPIDKYCSSRGFSIEARIRLMIQVCAAVHHAHQRSIIHRDLKPANLLVADVDGQAMVKVIDFGVAKAVKSDSTEALYETYFRQSIGTPMYMSPEQLSVRGTEVDERADVYALGGVLYHLLAGVAPLEPSDSVTDIGGSLHEYVGTFEPAAPSVRVKSAQLKTGGSGVVKLGISASQISMWIRRLKGPLDAITMKALQKSPNDRYKSVYAMADDLQRFIDGRPVQAKSSGFGNRAFAFVKRQKTVVALVGVVMLLSCVGVVVYEQRKTANLARLALAEKDRESLERLEAIYLKNAITAFGNHDVCTMQELELPRDPTGNLVGTKPAETEIGNGTGSLRKLLSDATILTPVMEMWNDSGVNELALSQSRRYVAAACKDGNARIWDMQSGRLVGMIGPHEGELTAAQFSPDGTKLAIGDWESWLTLWDVSRLEETGSVASKQPLGRVKSEDTSIESIAWSNNGSRIAAGYRYGATVQYDENLKEVFRIDHGPRHPRNNRIFFSADGDHLYMTNWITRYVEKWDLNLGINLWPVPQDGYMNGPIGSPHVLHAFKNSILHTLDKEASVAVLDGDSGEFQNWLSLGAGNVKEISISPDHHHCLTSHGQGSLVVSNVIEDENGVPEKLGTEVIYRGYPVNSEDAPIEFLDNERFVSGGSDGKLCLWRLSDVQIIRKIALASDSMYSFDDSGDAVEIGFRTVDDGEIGETDPGKSINDGEFARRKILLRSTSYTQSSSSGFQLDIREAESGNCIVLRNERGVEIFDIHTGKRLATVDSPEGPPDSVAMSRDGRFLIYACGRAGLVWETEDRWQTSQLKSRCQLEFEGNTSGQVAVSITGRFAIYTSRFEVIVIDVASGKIIRRFEGRGHPRFRLSPSERLIAVFDEFGVRVHELDTGQVITSGRLPYCHEAQFVDDERILLTLDTENAIHAWHLPTGTALGIVYQAEAGSDPVDFFLTNSSQLCVQEFCDSPSGQQMVVLGRPK